jgi:homoserine acetyltransferase
LDGRNKCHHVHRNAQGPQRPRQQHKPFPRHQQHCHEQRQQQPQQQQQQQQKRFFGMKDEYGTMDSNGHTYVKAHFALENGVILPHAQLRYQTYGTLNDRRDNVLVVCHALTGNASLHTWWGDLLGDGRAFDTSQYLVVCCNILGSCYGSTNPRSINPETGVKYGKDFPDVSVIDSVRLQLLLLQEELGIHSIKSVIGGSFGGMQAIEYAVQGGSQDADFVAEDGKRQKGRRNVYSSDL